MGPNTMEVGRKASATEKVSSSIMMDLSMKADGRKTENMGMVFRFIKMEDLSASTKVIGSME